MLKGALIARKMHKRSFLPSPQIFSNSQHGKGIKDLMVFATGKGVPCLTAEKRNLFWGLFHAVFAPFYSKARAAGISAFAIVSHCDRVSRGPCARTVCARNACGHVHADG